MVSDNSSKIGKLAKLTQLENEVAKLSEQLKVNKNTVSLLKKSLTERDLKIQELESKLEYAQQSLLKKAVLTIHQCRDQIRTGIDEKIINPALIQLQQQIEVIQGIVYEARDILNKKKTLINEGIHVTSNIVHQCPDQAIRYFERRVVEPSRLLVDKVSGLIDRNLRVGQDLVEQKIVYPCKDWRDKIIVIAQGLPGQSQAIFQTWLDNTVMDKIGTLPAIKKGLRANAIGLLNSLTGRIKNEAEQILKNAVNAIKKSPFWDGKRRMETV